MPFRKKRKVIIQLGGGLGNQMFMYAFGKALAIRNDAILYVEKKNGFRKDTYKRYFTLGNVLSENIYLVKSSYSLLLLIARKFNVVASVLGIHIHQEGKKQFEKEALHLSSPVNYVVGYWQSPYYFSDIKDDILMAFCDNNSLTAKAKEMLKLIQTNNQPIALHARLKRSFASDGTLVTNDDSKDVGKAFYKHAISVFKEKYADAHFFIFSDNIDEALKLSDSDISFTAISNQNLQEWEEWLLMKNCKHYIIPNSTFSWWAAWLGEHSEKEVIAPPARFWDNKDILPQSWIIL